MIEEIPFDYFLAAVRFIRWLFSLVILLPLALMFSVAFIAALGHITCLPGRGNPTVCNLRAFFGAVVGVFVVSMIMSHQGGFEGMVWYDRIFFAQLGIWPGAILLALVGMGCDACLYACFKSRKPETDMEKQEEAVRDEVCEEESAEKGKPDGEAAASV